jgi:hypothetical protein
MQSFNVTADFSFIEMIRDIVMGSIVIGGGKGKEKGLRCLIVTGVGVGGEVKEGKRDADGNPIANTDLTSWVPPTSTPAEVRQYRRELHEKLDVLPFVGCWWPGVLNAHQCRRQRQRAFEPPAQEVEHAPGVLPLAQQ